MTLTDPSQSRTTNLQNSTTDYTAGEEPWNKNLDGYDIDTKSTDTSTYLCNWPKWHGVYREVDDFRATIDVWCKWIIGKKIKAKNAKTKRAIKRIKGNGKQTFRQILENIKRVSKIGGDGIAEIITDKAGRLINIKVLDPGTIEIHSDKYNQLKKYRQVSFKGYTGDKSLKMREAICEWKPDEIFHIMNDPIADEIHGIPEAEKLLKTIKMINQGQDDYCVMLHRYGKPTYFFEAETDDDDELKEITDTINNAFKNFENAVTPKGTLSDISNVRTAQYSTIDPLPWFQFLRSKFTGASNVPDLIRGKSDEVSLAAGKLNYLGFKEKIEMEQIEFAEQIENQLSLQVEFEPPQDIDIEVMQENQDKINKENAKNSKKISQGKAEIK